MGATATVVPSRPASAGKSGGLVGAPQALPPPPVGAGLSPLSYYPALARAVGSLHAAVVIAYFAERLAPGDDGWFGFRLEDVCEGTALSGQEVETARARLVALGVLTEQIYRVPQGRGAFVRVQAHLDVAAIRRLIRQ